MFTPKEPTQKELYQARRARKTIAWFIGILFLGFMAFIAYQIEGGDLQQPALNIQVLPSLTTRSTQVPQVTEEIAPDLRSTQVALEIQIHTATALVEQRIAASTQQYVDQQIALQQELNNKEIEQAQIQVAIAQEELRATQEALPVILEGMRTQQALDADHLKEVYRIERDQKAIRWISITAGITLVTITASGLILWLLIWGAKHTKRHREDLSIAEMQSLIQQKKANQAAIQKATEIQMILEFINEAIRVAGDESHIIPTNSKMPSYSANRWQDHINLLKKYQQIKTTNQGTFINFGDLGDIRDDIEAGEFPVIPDTPLVLNHSPAPNQDPNIQTTSQESGSNGTPKKATTYQPIGEDRF